MEIEIEGEYNSILLLCLLLPVVLSLCYSKPFNWQKTSSSSSNDETDGHEGDIHNRRSKENSRQRRNPRRKGKGKVHRGRRKQKTNIGSIKHNNQNASTATTADNGNASITDRLRLFSSSFLDALSRFIGLEIRSNSITEDERLGELLALPSVTFVAMDCEMVGYGRQGINSMLARCSLVTIDEINHDGNNGKNGTCNSYNNSVGNGDGDIHSDAHEISPTINVLYDVYVKPTKNITDYRTEYSGITPDHLLREDAVTFEVCRSKVMALLKPSEDRIFVLVGHALKNDFQVLRYWHPRSLVRDTAYYKPFMTPVRKRFLPKKLSFLAETHLGIHIQKNNCTFNINYGEHAREMEEHDRGHSSIEDAAAALMLYKTVSAKWEERLGHPLNERRSKWV